MTKVMQLTDLHFEKFHNHEKDQKTIELIEGLVELENPDYIILTGDIVSGDSGYGLLDVFRNVCSWLDQLGSKIAITYGNHDSEGWFLRHLADRWVDESGDRQKARQLILEDGSNDIYFFDNYDKLDTYGRDELNEITSQMKNHVQKENLATMDTRQMYTFQINDETKALIVDGGDYDLSLGFYASITLDQHEWLIEQAGDPNEVSHLFLHMALPEYAYAKREGLAVGNQDDEDGAPSYNNGTWYKLKTMTNVKAVHCGHDHENDFIANYYGIDLCYGRASGFSGYGKLKRGARMLVYKGREYSTYIVDEDDLNKEK